MPTGPQVLLVEDDAEVRAVVRTFLERLPQLAILLMSGFSAELLDADRDSPPSWELLRKPYSREELAGAIARVLGSPDAAAP